MRLVSITLALVSTEGKFSFYLKGRSGKHFPIVPILTEAEVMKTNGHVF